MNKFDKVKAVYIENEGYVDDLYIFEIKEDKVLLKEHDDDKGYWVDVDEVEVIPDIRELAEYYDKDYIVTTTGTNGYPEHLKPAMIGFDTFEEAQEIAEEHGLNIECFTKKDGWRLWSRNNAIMFEPFTNSVEDYGDNYLSLQKMDEHEFMESEVNPVLEQDFESFTELDKIIENKREIWEEIDAMDDDELVITDYGQYYETIRKESMYFTHDTKHYVIGLIDNN